MENRTLIECPECGRMISARFSHCICGFDIDKFYGVTREKPNMEEIRCSNCGRLLCKMDTDIPHRIEIKCPKCKRVQSNFKSKLIDYDTENLKLSEIKIKIK